MESQVDALEKRLLSAESQVNELQARLNDAVGQRKHWEDEHGRVRKELDHLKRQLASAKRELEEETVARVDLENRVQSLKEEMEFKNSVHQQVPSDSPSMILYHPCVFQGTYMHNYLIQSPTDQR